MIVAPRSQWNLQIYSTSHYQASNGAFILLHHISLYRCTLTIILFDAHTIWHTQKSLIFCMHPLPPSVLIFKHTKLLYILAMWVFITPYLSNGTHRKKLALITNSQYGVIDDIYQNNAFFLFFSMIVFY